MSYNIHHHLNYNEWANTKISIALQLLDDEIYYLDNKSSFPSIAATVAHIWRSQLIWLTRMQGENLNKVPLLEPLPNKILALGGLVTSSRELVSFVQSKDTSFLSTTYQYKNLKGVPFEDPYEDTLFHVVNHSTYHRGQVITMLRQAGITLLPSTDLIHYLRALKDET